MDKKIEFIDEEIPEEYKEEIQKGYENVLNIIDKEKDGLSLDYLFSKYGYDSAEFCEKCRIKRGKYS